MLIKIYYSWAGATTFCIIPTIQISEWNFRIRELITMLMCWMKQEQYDERISPNWNANFSKPVIND